MVIRPAPPQVELAGAEKLGNEVRWVAVSPAYLESARCSARYVAWLAPVFLVVAGVLLVFVFGAGVLEDAKVRGHLATTTVALLAFAGITPFAARRTRERLARYRLGASIVGLSWQLPTNASHAGDRPGRVPWRDVYFDGNILLAGRQRLPVRIPQRRAAIFDPEELRRAILVHVPKDNLVTPGQLQMRMAGKWAWLLAFAVVAVMVWALFAMNIIPGNP